MKKKKKKQIFMESQTRAEKESPPCQVCLVWSENRGKMDDEKSKPSKPHIVFHEKKTEPCNFKGLDLELKMKPTKTP